MEKTNCVENKIVFPLKVLVEQADACFVKTDTAVCADNIIGICVREKAWCLSRVPTFPYNPDSFLDISREVSGLPLAYPDKDDFIALHRNFAAVKETFEKILDLEKMRNWKGYSKIKPFVIEESAEQEDFLKQIVQYGKIRFVVELNKLF